MLGGVFTQAEPVVYLLYGADDFSRAQFLAQLKQGLVTGDSGLLPANLNILAGNQLSFPELAQVCDAYPFLAEKRLVIVEGLLSRFEGRPQDRETGRGQRSTAEVEHWRRYLVEYLPRIPPTTVLALVDGLLRGDNLLLRALSPLAQVREFAPLRPPAIVAWIQAHVAQAGGSTSAQAAQTLAEAVGPNLWALTNEVDKLLAYCQGRPIGVEEVHLLVAQSREATVFAFVDAMLEGPRSRALLLLHRLFLDGASSPYLTAMVSRQLRFLLEAQDMVAQCLTEEEIGQRLGLAGFPRRKTWEQAHRLDQKRLLGLYDDLLELDVAIKTGRRSEETAWEVLVAETVPS